MVQKAPLLVMAWNNDAKRPMACGGVGQLGAPVVRPYHQGVGQSQYKDWQGRRDHGGVGPSHKRGVRIAQKAREVGVRGVG